MLVARVNRGERSMKRILIADDEKDLRFVLREVFEDYKQYDVYEAKDGDEALDMALRLQPDLILLDVMMPGRTGYDVAQEIVKRQIGSIIIMLSAKAQKSDMEEGLKKGADYYIKKPFDLMELMRLVEKALEGRKA